MRRKRVGFVLSAAVIFAMVFGWALEASAILMGGSIQGTALNLSPASVSTLAGTAGVSGSANGTGPAASFHWPYGITTDGANLYVTDNFNNTIRKIVIATGAVTTLAGTAGVSGHADGTGPAASFNGPTGITTDGTFLYVAEITNCTIRKIRIATKEVTTLAGTALSCGNSGTTFNHPRGITYNGTWLFVADSDNNTIRFVDKVTGSVGILTTTTWPGDLTANSDWLFTTDPSSNIIHEILIANGVDYAPISGIGLNYSLGITGDGTSMYISDTNNHRICKPGGGACVNIAGTTGTSGSADGANALFNTPVGITTDGVNLYVCDWGNNTIRKIGLYTPPPTTYLISTTWTVGGSMTPGNTTVNSGSTQAFTINVNSGYTISSVTGCGGTLNGATYTTGPITASCTVAAVFAASNTASTLTMPVPVSKATFSYASAEEAVQSDNPMNAKPIGVGKIASGGSKINIYIGLAQFSAPVDIYFAISAPAIDPNNIYLLSPLHLFQPLSAGLTAWKSGTTSPVSESLFGEFPASSLPKGTYTLYLAVTPTGSISSYYLWTTDFIVN